MELRLYTDALKFAIGGYLTQVDPSTNEEVLLGWGVFSQRLNEVNRNHFAFERELHAAITSVPHFVAYLHGQNFTLYSYNQAEPSLDTSLFG